MNQYNNDIFDRDVERTLQNSERLLSNRNIMKWYGKLYETMFAQYPNIDDLKVLEVGSGTSPLRKFFPTIMTSDILPLPHLDYVFDCMKIDEIDVIDDHSLDIITFTNVLHHLPDPIVFLQKASKKIKKNTGRLIFAEPYMSKFMYPVYKYLHYEKADKDVSKPILDSMTGPLSGANQAIPYLIFFKREKWLQELRSHYEIDSMKISYFTSISYFLTGGIDRRFSIPQFLFALIINIDIFIGRVFPKLLSSFFISDMQIGKNHL